MCGYQHLDHRAVPRNKGAHSKIVEIAFYAFTRRKVPVKKSLFFLVHTQVIAIGQHYYAANRHTCSENHTKKFR